MKQRLFVYGTLHLDRAPEEIRDVVKRLVPLGAGSIVGSLHDLGEYPALTLDSKTTRVQGTVFSLPDDPEVLQRLDQYEDYLPGNPDNSLFVRSRRLVTLDDGTRQYCWVYLYNRRLPATSLPPQPAAGKT